MQLIHATRRWDPPTAIGIAVDPAAAFPLPPDAGPTLRLLFSNPVTELAAPEPEATDAVLDLARWHGKTEEVALLTGRGSADPLLLGLELTSAQAPSECSDGRILVPLTVPLLPSGNGCARVFAAIVLRDPVSSLDLERLARHGSRILVAAELRRRADRDTLTELLSRRAFERRLPAANECLVAGAPLAVVMLDVDGLRELNAARGVRTGDELLRTLGALARGALGPQGVAARYGGDELALLAPGLDADGAAELTDRLAAAIGQLVDFGEPGPTVSMGVASGPEHGDDLASLVLHADQALARAKDEGGARVVTWSPTLRFRRRQDRLAGLLTGHEARDRRHVAALLDTVREVSALAPLSDILTTVVDRCVAVAGAERGLLLLADGGGWSVRVARGPSGTDLPQDERAYAQSVVDEVTATGATLSRLAGDEAISPSAEQLGLAAIVCAPLEHQDVPPGVLYVDTSTRREPFDAATVAFFDALVGQVSVALRNAVLYERATSRVAGLAADVANRDAELVRVRQRWDRDAAPAAVPGLVGVSPGIQEVLRLLENLAGTAIPVIVHGESGTGKELVSRAIHTRSGRTGPLVTVNCAAITPSLFESEFFGHCRGAFTGAHTDREGFLEAARGGTLFMDEVAELPLAAQAKLLRALQEREVRRVGESQVRPIDVRVVAATNQDLQAMVDAGDFRQDLYYRLAVFRIHLPPLRDRVEDVPLIAAHLLEACADRPIVLGRDAIRVLVRRRWPGNVRELRNALQRALVLAGDGPILPEHLEIEEDTREPFSTSDLLNMSLKAAKASFGVIYAKEMLKRSGGSYPEAAKLAGVTRQTLYRILADS